MKRLMTGIVCAGALAAMAETTYGPLGNEEDQFRFLWGGTDRIAEDMIRCGFNTAIDYSVGYWDCNDDRPLPDIDRRVRIRKDRLDHYLSIGLGSVEQIRYSHNRNLMKRFPRIQRDGTKKANNIDAADPAFREIVRHAVREEARTLGGHPAIVGFQTASEIRDNSTPSYTPALAAAYRAHSGHDIPALAAGRNPPHWSKVPGFPANRIVPDDWPLLDFYRWNWKHGDGWNDYQSLVVDEFDRAFGRKVLSMYDPSIRTPPFWGNGGKVTHLNHWTYVYPEPFNISYNISQQQSMARGGNQRVWAMIQAISYRSRIAPIGEHPANEPAWTREFPEARYPSTPPDVVQEAMWSVYSRQVDGIGFHGWNALWDGKIEDREHHTSGYQCANPATLDTVQRIFTEVGAPLGPLFRAIPERPPEVAVLESYASTILGGRVTWDCQGAFFDCGVLATAANLMPYALNEEQLAKEGVPPSVKTLLLPACDVLTESAYRQIRKFVARGGRLVADGLLTPALKADAALPSVASAFNEIKSDHDDGKASPATDASVRAKAMQRAAAQLRAAAAVTPYADADRPDILASARSNRSADYVFAINDKRTFGDYVGPWKRLMEKGLPNSGTVTVNRAAGAVYDLVRHTAVPFESKGGKTSVRVDYATNDGRVFLVTDAPLRPLAVACEKSGRVTVTSPDADVLIPIRVDVPGAKPFYAVVRDGRWTRTFNGAGKVKVTSLADGKSY